MIINNTRQKDELKSFVLYTLIGSIAVAFDNIIFNLLRIVNLNVYVTNFIAVNCGLTISFICNTFVNFKTKDNLFHRVLSFFTIGYAGMILSMISLHYGVILIGIREWIIKLISTGISGMVQFGFNKIITFREY